MERVGGPVLGHRHLLLPGCKLACSPLLLAVVEADVASFAAPALELTFRHSHQGVSVGTTVRAGQ